MTSFSCYFRHLVCSQLSQRRLKLEIWRFLCWRQRRQNRLLYPFAHVHGVITTLDPCILIHVFVLTQDVGASASLCFDVIYYTYRGLSWYFSRCMLTLRAGTLFPTSTWSVKAMRYFSQSVACIIFAISFELSSSFIKLCCIVSFGIATNGN